MALSGRWQEALALLNDMPRQGLSPDARTYSAASKFDGQLAVFFIAIVGWWRNPYVGVSRHFCSVVLCGGVSCVGSG